MSMLRRLELEITTRCNARCSVCPRFSGAETNANLGQHDLDPNVLAQHITDSTWQGIKLIRLKGTVGDCLFHPRLDDMLDLLWQQGATVAMDTNGNARSTGWWQSLAQRWGDRLHVAFCLDGVDPDTHQRYRGTSWQRVTDNARHFIDAGGHATWFFIVFRHNEHQLAQATETARDWGFRVFESISSERYDELDASCQSPVLAQRSQRLVFDLGQDSYIFAHSNAVATCPNINNGERYIAADGQVWPCCFYGSSNLTADQRFWSYYLKRQLGNDASRLNINARPLQEIMDDPVWAWWAETVARGTNNKCNTYCGERITWS